MKNKIENVEVLKPEVEQIVDAGRKIVLYGKEDFADAIFQYKNELVQLVNSGVLSEQTAQRLAIEAEYTFFQQITKIEYK